MKARESTSTRRDDDSKAMSEVYKNSRLAK